MAAWPLFLFVPLVWACVPRSVLQAGISKVDFTGTMTPTTVTGTYTVTFTTGSTATGTVTMSKQ